ncbi:hypothetical protein COCCADRAFT_31679 [Bipolaris zeicola 26-R-13]|uniref:Carbohydrate-binding module family 19 domain-containing protein n=1 Tax=Cochliobolus carbonum (strain 26-R-13) TaxID=930089 RepID=W6YIZ1_COCC2|nr:uncharacterized protein COCCADRAFT_31679 [Bipolaris zeicola 26-R-13]EUC39302.1 hypothetical protein COCCADRAFT_31679 [Bipolaris zeicola 26-R-13]
MKLVAVLATVLSVVSAVAIPAELQERQCLNNGTILCGDTNTTCQPPGTACIMRKGNN